MAHRSSAPDLPRAERTERWDRDRYEYERDHDRYGDVHERFEEEDDHVYVRRAPPRDDRPPRRFRPGDEDDVVFRERRRVVYDDEPPRPAPRRPSPPADLRRRPPSPPGSEVERSRVVIEKERYRSPSPSPVRPRLLRRQSSLDTFDRKPKRYYERDEDGPPARREDHRAPPFVDIPLPRTRALPPPRAYAERDYYDEVSDLHRYGDDDFRAYPERVREREVVRTRRRTRSRDSRAASRPGRSRSSSTSSSSSSTGGTALTARSEYPKKGKTRIPARLVSKRALIDLGYPFVEEGSTIIVQKALGQQNIDDLLKLSDDYKKSELEIVAARSSAGDIVEERVERRTEVYEGPAAMVAAAHPPPAGTGPVIITKEPPPSPVEVVKTTVIRDVSPARTYTTSSYDTTGTSYDATTTTFTSAPPVFREVSERVPVGPVALASRSRSRRRSSLDADELRSEIRHLERQLALRDGRRHHHHHHHHHSSSRSRSSRSRSRRRRRHRSSSREVVVRAERLSTGELVLYEDEVELLLEEPARGGVRIERDKRGRLSINVPRRG